MPTGVVRAIDRLLADVLLAGARQSWPVLNRVPSRWLRPLLMPTARRLRPSLLRWFLAAALMVAGALLALIH